MSKKFRGQQPQQGVAVGDDDNLDVMESQSPVVDVTTSDATEQKKEVDERVINGIKVMNH